MNRILAGAIGLAVVGAAFQSLLRDRLDQDLSASNVSLDESQRQQIDGLVAGSQEAREAIAKDSTSTADQVEAIASDAFTYALGNSIWVLVGVAGLCTVLTWWLVAPKHDAPAANSADPSGDSGPKQHHRFGGFHF